MPKRPCAVTFTPNEKTILCGDKFGDVYALPLNPAEAKAEEKHGFVTQSRASPKAEEDQEPQITRFVPSASTRTVHTLTNQQVLKQQLNSANKKPPPKTLAFEHQLVLGHVSLLTDIACVAVPGADTANPQDRTYIITADRDEHIRVSRSMPQAHIIEGFCLGHTQFVSKLCVPNWNPRLLISGGGDDHLLVWDWVAGFILHKVNLQRLVMDYISQHFASPELLSQDSMDRDTVQAGHTKCAVCELHSAEATTVAGELRRYIVVAIEWYATLVCSYALLTDGCGIVYQQFSCLTLPKMGQCSTKHPYQQVVMSLHLLCRRSGTVLLMQ